MCVYYAGDDVGQDETFKAKVYWAPFCTWTWKEINSTVIEFESNFEVFICFDWTWTDFTETIQMVSRVDVIRAGGCPLTEKCREA